MPKKRKGPRLYTRSQGGQDRYYADLRPYGGRREALIPNRATVATTDPVIAQKLVSDRLRELEAERRGQVLLGTSREDDLAGFARHHLIEKAKSDIVTTRFLEQAEKQLAVMIEFLGASRPLASIGVVDVQRLAYHLSEKGGRSGTGLAPGSVRHYLNSLSNLYRRAQGEGCVPPGFNPVASMMDKPTAARKEARWLEIHEASLFLESARTWKPDTDAGANPAIYPIVATFLLTGGRASEVLGLDMDDLSFDRRTITFRPNRWRRLKTSTSHRAVPMWPQLEEILRAYVFGGSGPKSGLVFPPPPPDPARRRRKKATQEMVLDVRRELDAIGERAGWKAGEVRSKMFRHTYCAARLQTLDRGHPVSVYTVAKEMGHGGDNLVKRVYGHLGTVRHRAEVIEYRVGQHRGALGDRLAVLR